MQPHCPSRWEGLGVRAAHPLAVFAHTLGGLIKLQSSVYQPCSTTIFLRHACTTSCHGAVIHAVHTAKSPSVSACGSSSSFGTSMQPHGPEIILPRHCAAPSACSNARTSRRALAAMRLASCALAKSTEAGDTRGTPSLNMMLSLEMCSPSCAANRCARQTIRKGRIIATSSSFN